MRLFGVILAMMVGLAQMALAQTPVSYRSLASTDFSTLPAPTQKELRNAPAEFVEEMAGLILGYGGPGGIGLEGIETYIGLERASARAYQIRKMLQGDLNGDGWLERSEMAALQRIVSARQRGVLEVAFRRGDRDQDGRVSPDELRALAQVAALKRVSADQAVLLRSILKFDLNADDHVTLDEVLHWVAAFRGDV